MILSHHHLVNQRAYRTRATSFSRLGRCSGFFISLPFSWRTELSHHSSSDRSELDAGVGSGYDGWYVVSLAIVYLFSFLFSRLEGGLPDLCLLPDCSILMDIVFFSLWRCGY
ncbi:hypothetical protein K458DRAFT_422548 [Lentithecium fluviatile CBS 122367]|uniref:Uncharacterized protein n=1 Tax=Lentithecium fluviatile CBS 122367 TaxID=1168545 RepID=A0A6G1ILT8_9PLEO|nr:hypothetical protein K458DRAFT_422548 [Lentithecium fluviatile CBS 122367]